MEAKQCRSTRQKKLNFKCPGPAPGKQHRSGTPKTISLASSKAWSTPAWRMATATPQWHYALAAAESTPTHKARLQELHRGPDPKTIQQQLTPEMRHVPPVVALSVGLGGHMSMPSTKCEPQHRSRNLPDFGSRPRAARFGRPTPTDLIVHPDWHNFASAISVFASHLAFHGQQHHRR